MFAFENLGRGGHPCLHPKLLLTNDWTAGNLGCDTTILTLVPKTSNRAVIHLKQKKPEWLNKPTHFLFLSICINKFNNQLLVKIKIANFTSHFPLTLSIQDSRIYIIKHCKKEKLFCNTRTSHLLKN